MNLISKDLVLPSTNLCVYDFPIVSKSYIVSFVLTKPVNNEAFKSFIACPIVSGVNLYSLP